MRKAEITEQNLPAELRKPLLYKQGSRYVNISVNGFFLDLKQYFIALSYVHCPALALCTSLRVEPVFSHIKPWLSEKFEGR